MFRPFQKESNFLLGQRWALYCTALGICPWLDTRSPDTEQINTKSLLTGIHTSLQLRALEEGLEQALKHFAWLRTAAADHAHWDSCWPWEPEDTCREGYSKCTRGAFTQAGSGMPLPPTLRSFKPLSSLCHYESMRNSGSTKLVQR